MTEAVLGIINGVLSAGLSLYLAYHLVFHPERFSRLGRSGAAVTGGGILLAGAALAYPHTPFEGWAAVVMRVGLVLIFIDWTRGTAR